MCEAWFRKLLEQNGLEREYTCSSAGVSACPSPASVNARMAVAEYGCSLEDHTARQFTPELAAEQDLILAISPSHYDIISRIAPEAAGKTRLICEQGIADPYGGNLDIYRECFDQIRNEVEKLFKTIKIQKG
jgi:protein-tyrosine phosphatase